MTDRAQHWDDAYAPGVAGKSWFQTEASPSLAMFDACGVTAADSVVDIGAGASPLVDALLARGHRDLTALDVSETGLAISRDRLGAKAAVVHWVVGDLLTWAPGRTYDVWHDRAVLHFLHEDAERAGYVRALTAATHQGSLVVLATFAPDGPEQCSGLPVRRADAQDLAGLLGSAWELVTAHGEVHRTPWGSDQSFTWAGFRRS